MDDIANDLDALSGILIAVYLGTVVYRGNVSKLYSLLTGEMGYLDFVLAIAILYLIYNNPHTSFLAPFILLGIAAIIISRSSNSNLASITSKFSSGQAGLLDTINETAKSLFSKG